MTPIGHSAAGFTVGELRSLLDGVADGVTVRISAETSDGDVVAAPVHTVAIESVPTVHGERTVLRLRSW